jgi:Protein of unknown function (DUF3311)
MFFANSVEPYVLGLPFAMFWVVMWVVLAAALMAIVYRLDTRERARAQAIVTLLLLGYALVTQLFPALLASLWRPGRVTRQGAIAGIVSGSPSSRRCRSRARRPARRRRSTRWSAGCRRSWRSSTSASSRSS